MRERRSPGLFSDLKKLFRAGTIDGSSEEQLIAQFDECGDEAAFAALVARYGPMVLSVCRRSLRDPRDVEDAFQATFLVLARKAGSLKGQNLLGPWLHTVAHRVTGERSSWPVVGRAPERLARLLDIRRRASTRRPW